MGVAVDGVLFLTTKGTEITKFSDIFIFVSFVLSVVDSIVFEPWDFRGCEALGIALISPAEFLKQFL